MKNWYITFVWLFGLLFVPRLFGCEMTVRTYPSAPLAILHEDKSWSGIDIDYSKALIDAIGCEYRFVAVPWARALQLLKTGDIDMMVNVTKSKAREQDYYFIGPQRHETIRLVSRVGAFDLIETWQQFATLDATLMRQKGSLFDNHFEKALRSNFRLKARLVELRSNEIIMGLIKKRRIDGVFAEQLVLKHRIKHDKTIPPLEIHPLVMSSIPVYYAFSKKNFTEQQFAQFKQAFEQLQQSDKFKRLSELYYE